MGMFFPCEIRVAFPPKESQLKQRRATQPLLINYKVHHAGSDEHRWYFRHWNTDTRSFLCVKNKNNKNYTFVVRMGFSFHI